MEAGLSVITLGKEVFITLLCSQKYLKIYQEGDIQYSLLFNQEWERGERYVHKKILFIQKLKVIGYITSVYSALFQIIVDLLKTELIIHEFSTSISAKIWVIRPFGGSIATNLLSVLSILQKVQMFLFACIFPKVLSIQLTFMTIFVTQDMTSTTSVRTCDGTSIIIYFFNLWTYSKSPLIMVVWKHR